MLGSNFVIVERMKSGVFQKFALHLLEQYGYVNLVKNINTESFNYTINKSSNKTIIKIDHSDVNNNIYLDLIYIKEVFNTFKSQNCNNLVVLTSKEFNKEALDFINKNNIEIIDRIKIDYWLRTKFDSCEKFINYLSDLDIKKHGKYNVKELTDNYLKIIKKHKKRLNEHEIRKYSSINSGTYMYKWGTWTNFILTTGQIPNVMNFKPNRSLTASVLQLIENYISVKDELGRIPNMLDIDTYGNYPSHFYFKYFGSWSSVIAIIETVSYQSQYLTFEQLEKEFIRVKKLVKITPTFSHMRMHSKYSPLAYLIAYKTWDKLLTSMNERQQFNNINDKTFIKAYFELKQILGKEPSYADLKQHYKFTHDTLAHKYGVYANFSRLMQNPNFATLEIKELDLFTDFFRIRKVLKKSDISINEIRRLSEYSEKDYLNIFKSWKNFFIIIADIDEQSEEVTQETLIYNYLELLGKLKYPYITLFDLQEHSQFYYPLYLCLFHSWGEFIIATKPYVSNYKSMPKLTNNDLIVEYRILEKKLYKSPLSYNDIKQYSKFPLHLYLLRFGSWKKFLEKLGYELPNYKNTRNEFPYIKLTKEDVVNEYYRLKKELKVDVVKGYMFTKSAKYSMSTVNKLFGNWINLLNELGENSDYFTRPTKQDLINEYYKVKNIVKKNRIFVKDVELYGKYGRAAYSNHFGSWIKFLEHINENTTMQVYSNQQLIDEYYKALKKSKLSYLTVNEFRNYSNISTGPYHKRWGTWINFLKTIGASYPFRVDDKTITKEMLIENYFALAKRLGVEFPTVHDIDRSSKYNRRIYEKVFGKWGLFKNFIKNYKQ